MMVCTAVGTLLTMPNIFRLSKRAYFLVKRRLLSTEDRINEAIMTGLRTIWGVSLEGHWKSNGEKYKIRNTVSGRKIFGKGHLIYRARAFVVKARKLFSGRWHLFRSVFIERMIYLVLLSHQIVIWKVY